MADSNSLATPCPAPDYFHRPRRSSSIAHLYNIIPDDTTTNIDFTRALPPSLLQNARPRRSSILHGKPANRRTAAVTIFEDLKEDDEPLLSENQPKVSGKTLLGKPARKMAPVAGAAAVGTAIGSSHRQPAESSRAAAAAAGGLRDIGQGRARPSIAGYRPAPAAAVEREQAAIHRTGTTLGSTAGLVDSTVTLARNPRRRTIYIPDDTTVGTIHPGADATARLDDTFQLPSFPLPAPSRGRNVFSVLDQSNDQSNLQQRVRRPRKSLMAAPRRGLVQISDNPMGDKAESQIEYGANTGKENIPPGVATAIGPDVEPIYDAPPPPPAPSRLTRPTTASRNRQSVMARNAVPLTSRPVTMQLPSPRLVGTSSRGLRVSKKTSPKKGSDTQQNEDIRDTIDIKRYDILTSKLKKFPVLSNDLWNTGLYETEWLGRQEVALAEIINGIFSATASASDATIQPEKLREGVIHLYLQPEVVILHQRLQASLLYGALSKPRTLYTSNSPTLHSDIGMRKRFISLWIDTYDNQLLQAAAEAVVGRSATPQGSAGHSQSPSATLDSDEGRRSLIEFLETFFVAVVDQDNVGNITHGTRDEADEKRWMKTTLRSIMLIWLLDQVKVSGLYHGTLFRSASPRKSSIAVTQALAGILIPFIGDIGRVLKQMSYEVTHVQDPLDEVIYHVKSLASDMRDGVFLAHLVEILLYSRGAKNQHPSDTDATLSIVLPDETVLQSEMYTPALHFNSRLLSQHLKMPCLGHAQQAFNVQVALSALQGHGLRAANIAGDVVSDNIVHGHREKTMSLLWALVNRYGLDYLVDWKELAADIKRIGGAHASSDNDGTYATKDHEQLLLDWAAAYAARAGRTGVENLTTSFADDTVYAIIVDAFAAYMPEPAHKPVVLPRGFMQSALGMQLESLGCSTAFIKQLTIPLGVIPSRETTVSNLAFLASRLLPLGKKQNAIITIQRTYRKRLALKMALQRIARMRTARDCATVAQTRERVTSAAVSIQRAWRAMMASRIEKWSLDVATFQVQARGWIVRKNANGYQFGETDRVMGGW